MKNVMNDNSNIIQSLFQVYPYIFQDFSIDDNIICSILDEKSTLESLNNQYEMKLKLKDKKDLGIFYTKNDIIIGKMLESLDLLNGKILEPACGSGLFLIPIIRRIIKLLEDKNYNSQMILNYICDNIYANDIDTRITKITEINIITILLPLIVDANNHNSDFKMNRLHITNYDFTEKDVYDVKFSIVIGNPPFVTMYGKHSRNMTEEKRSYFNTFNFVQDKHKDNKFNLSMFFVENGLNYLLEGGKLNFILDISFLETAFKDLRKYIVQNYFIEFMIVGLQEFEDVTSGQIIISIINKKLKNKYVNFIDYSTHEILNVNQDIWDNKLTKYVFTKPLNYIETAIITKMNCFIELGKLFPNKSLRTCCALTGKTEEFIVDPEEENKCITFPYIEGSKGLKGKFFTPTPNRYIKYDYELQLKLSDEFRQELTLKGIKNTKRVTLGDKDAYLAPKIFIRQSATEIIATYCSEPYAANNSIYILTTKENTPESINMLKYTCGLLNSDLITFYCRINKIIKLEKGKIPQIRISDLKHIKININDEFFEQIIGLVERLLITPENKQLYKELNSLVYRIYNIDENEQKFITEYLMV